MKHSKLGCIKIAFFINTKTLVTWKQNVKKRQVYVYVFLLSVRNKL